MIILEVMGDVFDFAKQNKKFIFVPVVVFLLLLSAFLLLTQGSVIAPFIYTLF